LRFVAGLGLRHSKEEYSYQVGFGKKSLTSLAKTHNVSRPHLSLVLNGHRNTTHLIKIIEEAWVLPISEIRELLKEDRDRKSANNPITKREAKAWHDEYKLKCSASREGQSLEEYKEKNKARLEKIRKMMEPLSGK
jgi:hypothetical protein